MIAINDTHDPHRQSWVGAANRPDADFPLQNLPFGVFEQGGTRRGGMAIGDQVFDIRAALEAKLFQGSAADAAEAAARPTLNHFMALGLDASSVLRARMADLLDERTAASLRDQVRDVLIPADSVRMHLPCEVGDYTDFLTSVHHTERHGRLKGLKDPLPPAMKSLPVAYHGRASSLRVSGTPCRRPYGQWLNGAGVPEYGPVASMDFELELGAYIGQGNALAEPIPIATAADHIFGYCLLNDWSAKGIQWWEQVLGPFLGKSFMTSLSPWIVTREALAPFAKALPPRPSGDPQPLAYLRENPAIPGSLSVQLQVRLQTASMREQGAQGALLCTTDLDCMYWTYAQMVAHHSSNGCNLRPGDLLGSGTLSGEQASSMACMTEMTSAGRYPLQLPNGEQRAWLADGDEVAFTAEARREGFRRIGFGTCSGMVMPA